MSSDRTEWLLEQIAEDERIASAEVERRAKWQADQYARGAVNTIVLLEFDDPGAPGDPERMLIECDAKRQIVEWCSEALGDRDLSRYGEIGALVDAPDAMAVTLAVETLCRLMLPYSGREGYREEWRP